MTFNAADLSEAIDNGATQDGYFDDEVGASQFYGDWWGANKTKKVTVSGVEYDATLVEEFGGMDMGSECWVVFEVDGRLFKKYGSYYSHDGYYWDGSLDEVRPVQKTITVFE